MIYIRLTAICVQTHPNAPTPFEVGDISASSKSGAEGFLWASGWSILEELRLRKML